MFGKAHPEFRRSWTGEGSRVMIAAVRRRVPRTLIHLAAIAAATAILVCIAWPLRFLGTQRITDCYTYLPESNEEVYLEPDNTAGTNPVFCGGPHAYQQLSAWLLGASLVGGIWLTVVGLTRALRSGWRVDKLLPALLWLLAGEVLLTINVWVAIPRVVV
jgi:hypothetical protein